MPAATYAETLELAYLLQGATATRVTSWSVGLSLGSPAEGNLSEFGAGSGYARQAVVFASSNINTFTNTAAVVFGAFSSADHASGFFVVNGANGSLLLYDTLTAAVTIRAGSIASFAAGNLRVILL